MEKSAQLVRQKEGGMEGWREGERENDRTKVGRGGFLSYIMYDLDVEFIYVSS